MTDSAAQSQAPPPDATMTGSEAIAHLKGVPAEVRAALALIKGAELADAAADLVESLARELLETIGERRITARGRYLLGEAVAEIVSATVDPERSP